MPKYWGKLFTHGRFPEVDQKQKKETKRAKVGNNNGHLCIANATSGGARKASWANTSFIFLFVGVPIKTLEY